MHNLKNSFSYLICLMTAVVPLQACAELAPLQYSAESIEAWVVDAETKEPLEGVVVVAHWVLMGGMHTDRVSELMIMETVTDAKGRFSFPGWGPKKAITTPYPPFETFLWYQDPELLLFKSGYEYKVLSNELLSKPSASSVRKSDWNGKIIEMGKFKGSLEEYAKHFEDLNHILEFSTREPDACEWKKIPRTILAMRQQRKYFEGKGVNPHTLSSLDQELIMNDEYYTKKGGNGCGSPKEFIRSLQQ